MDTLTNNTEYLNQYVIPWGVNIITALAVFIIGRWIAKGVVNILKRMLSKGGIDETLCGFLGKIAYAALLIAVIIASLDQLGVDTTSVLAVFATAGLAIGLALKDSLSNFSAGVMLILFKPFKLGDFVEAAGSAGVVEQISIFNTIMRTGDNREIIIPNAQIYGGTIVNVSAKETRRIDLVFGIGYNDDIRQAKQIIEKIMAEDKRILEDPEPSVAVGELADSSVNLNVRPWVNSADYWPVRADLLQIIKENFDASGISIPFPQQDVHMHSIGQQVKAA
jgi:small conductance mechanosensitive channel